MEKQSRLCLTDSTRWLGCQIDEVVTRLPEDPRQNLRTTAAYYAAFAAMGFSMASLGPTLPALAENTRASLGAISVLFTARSLGSLVGSVWGGRIYDYRNGHHVMANFSA